MSEDGEPGANVVPCSFYCTLCVLFTFVDINGINTQTICKSEFQMQIQPHVIYVFNKKRESGVHKPMFITQLMAAKFLNDGSPISFLQQ